MELSTIPLHWLGAIALLALLVAFGAWLKGRRPILWYCYALVLLPVAGLHVLFVDWRKSCPHCKSRVPLDAEVCPSCTWSFSI